MSFTRQVAHNTIIQASGKGLGFIFGIFSVAILARYLGLQGFGEYSTIMALVQLFSIVADFGLYQIALQLLPQKIWSESKIISGIWSLRIILAVIFLTLGWALVFFIPGYSWHIRLGTGILSLAIFGTSLNQILASLYQKHLRMWTPTLAEVLSKAANLGLLVLAVAFNLNFYWVMATIAVPSLLQLAWNWFGARRLTVIHWDYDPVFFKEVIRRAWPIGVSIILGMLYFKMDTVILSWYQPQTAVGVYGAAYKILEVLNSLPYLFIGLILPVLNAAWTEKNHERFKRVLQKAWDFSWLLIWPMIFGGILLSDQIIILITGRQFVAAAPIFCILLPAVGALFIGQLFTGVVIAINRQKLMLRYYLIVTVVALAGYFILIPRWSYWGAAWMTLAVELAIAIMAYSIVIRHANIIFSWRLALKALLAALLMSICLILIPSLPIIPEIILGAALYFGWLYLLKGYHPEVVREIISFKPKNTEIQP